MEEKEIKKVLRTGRAMLIATLVFLVLTVGLIGGAFYIRYNETKDPKDLGQLIENYEDKEGEYVKINLAYLPYGFAEEDSSKFYYFAMDQENYMYIIRMTDETYEKLKELSNDGNDKIEYEFKGYTFSQPTQMKQLAVEAANEAFEETKFTYSNISDYVGSVYIDETELPDEDTSVMLVGFSIMSGVFVLVFGITLLIQRIREWGITSNKELMEQLKMELEDLTDNPYKKQKIYLTSKHIISKSGGLSVLEYNQIIWMYSQIRYVNGVAQGKTLIACTKSKRKYTLATTGPNDMNIEEIMTEIKDRNEEVRIGYTKENREFYRNYKISY